MITHGVLDVLTVATRNCQLAKLAVNEEKLIRKVLALRQFIYIKYLDLQME